jgi:hypothetical protein
MLSVTAVPLSANSDANVVPIYRQRIGTATSGFIKQGFLHKQPAA